MGILFFLLFLLSFPALIYFTIRWIISNVKHDKPHQIKMLKMIGASAGVMIVSFILFIAIPSSDNPTEKEKIETAAPVVKAEPKEKTKVEPKKEPELTEEQKAELAKKEEEKKVAAELKEKEAAEARSKAEENLKKAEEARKAKEAADAKAEAEQIAKEKADKRANAKTIPYAQLKKNPDRYAGEHVKYTGEIIQILEGSGITNIRLSVIKETYGYSINDLVFVEYAGYTDFVDGDIVTIYGDVYGAYSYESQAGYNISLPGIIASEIIQ